jgi:hypothetical protein
MLDIETTPTVLACGAALFAPSAATDADETHSAAARKTRLQNSGFKV